MMEPSSVIATGKGAVAVGQTAYKGWGWFRRWWYGSVRITHPHNRAVVSPGMITVEGTHNTPTRGRFWLVTAHDGRYWLKTRIALRPDGQWQEHIHIGTHPGPRLDTILLVRASATVDSLLSAHKELGKKANDWSPIPIDTLGPEFPVVESITVQVENRS
jgi:hypothetical protein